MKRVFTGIFVILCVFALLLPVGAEPWLENTILSVNVALGDTSDFFYSRFEKIEGVQEVFTEYEKILKTNLGFNPRTDVKNAGVLGSMYENKPILLGYFTGTYNKKKLCSMLDDLGSKKILKKEFKGQKIYTFLNKRGSKIVSLYILNNDTLLLCKKSVLQGIIEGKLKILPTPKVVQKKYKNGLHLWASIKSLKNMPIANKKKAGKVISFMSGMFEELSLSVADLDINMNFTCPSKESADNMSALLKGQIVNLKAMIDSRLKAIKKPDYDKTWMKSAMKYLTSNVTMLVAKSVLKTAKVDQNGSSVDLAVSMPEGLLPSFGPMPIALAGAMAAIAIPNFKKARARAKQRACFANQRVLLGAIEMYNMDNEGAITEVNAKTMKLLVDGGYLKKIVTCADDGVYSSMGDISKEGSIKCSMHGSVDYK